MPSYPFILWCRQRTGSISLFTALSSVSEYKAAEMEPFTSDDNRPRQFTHVPGLPRFQRDEALRKICDTPYLIKHCYEHLPDDFNHALAEIATKAGYRHIHLVRRDEVARLVSKAIAEKYRTWFPCEGTTKTYANLKRSGEKIPLDIPALKAYHDQCAARWRPICSLLSRTKSARAIQSAFEELLLDRGVSTDEDESPRFKAVVRIVDFLNLPPLSYVEIEKRLAATRGQNTADLYPLIPNLNELRRAILQ